MFKEYEQKVKPKVKALQFTYSNAASIAALIPDIVKYDILPMELAPVWHLVDGGYCTYLYEGDFIVQTLNTSSYCVVPKNEFLGGYQEIKKPAPTKPKKYCGL